MDKLDRINKLITKFRDDRDWKQFHTPENLTKSICLEAAELLELFQWDSEFEEERLKEELADVLIYCLLLADISNLDVSNIIEEKLTKNNVKYPVDKFKSSNRKYNEL